MMLNAVGQTESRFRSHAWTWIAIIGAAISLTIFLRFASNSPWGDDWQLYADALRGRGPWDPISAHFRPLVRLQFALFAVWPSPVAFHLFSLVLHLLATLAAWFYLRTIEAPRIAMLATALFAGSFLANEAIYWISATGPASCLLFTLLAALAWKRDRPVAAFAFLVIASLSYELWLVGILLCAMERRKPWHRWAGPFGALLLFLALQLTQVGADRSAGYGGLRLSALGSLPLRLALYFFRTISPLSPPPGLVLSAAILVGLCLLALRQRYRAPVFFYFASAAILALSTQIASRFYYFPQLAIVWILALTLEEARWIRFAGALVLVWFVSFGPVINALDGTDYERLGALHERIYREADAQLGTLKEGETIVIADRTDDRAVLFMGARAIGRPKLYFQRVNAIDGAIVPEDLATILFSRRGWVAAPVAAAAAGREIVMHGDAAPRLHAFRVDP